MASFSSAQGLKLFRCAHGSSSLVLLVVPPPPHGLPPLLRPHQPTEQQRTQKKTAPDGRFHPGSTSAEPAQDRADLGRAAGSGRAAAWAAGQAAHVG